MNDIELLKILGEMKEDIGEIKGSLEGIHKELKKVNGRIRKNEDDIDELDKKVEQHKTYFKIIGFVISFTITGFFILLSTGKI